ncbi:MAG: hypothetical protein HQ497_01690 [SAR86 cluster bacterium]|uniref:DUF6285 domain-containing protein n=1 Tax=SAR86 cluster bacterium TaxID=2030880 RepID=A0A973A856_9GAMM|nr:hypothetical protein [SAR86 cluster bacterium]
MNLVIPGIVTPVQPEQAAQTLDMPRADELLTAVRDFLRADVMDGTTGRVNFLARVAGNALDIVLRESQLGGAARALELEKLRLLYGSAVADDDLEALRWRLTRELRDGTQDLDDERLHDYLRHAVANQIAIDQPRYSGFKVATGQSS